MSRIVLAIAPLGRVLRPPARCLQPFARSFSASVVEDATDSFVKRKRQRDLETPPVPVADGEYLVYMAGNSTKKSVLTSWVGTGVLWTYLVGVKAIEFADAGLQLIGPTMTGVLSVVAGFTTVMAIATSRCMVRYAVLTADGQHARLYTYGPLFGAGVSSPVTVPISFLREHGPDSKAAQSDLNAVYVRVKDSAANIVFDKPAHLPIPSGPGTALAWSDRGVALAKGGLPKGSQPKTQAAGAGQGQGGASAGEANSIYLLSSADREDLRRYAVLAHILQPETTAVNTSVLTSGLWELDAVKEQAGPRSLSPKDREVADLALWRKAVDGDTGREYWYHEVTWARTWAMPTVQGKGPYDWFPERASLPVPTVRTPPDLTLSKTKTAGQAQASA